MAFISSKEFSVVLIFSAYGAVGKGKMKTSGIPIDFNCSNTLSKGNLHISGKGYYSIMLA
jgi:hypothetical protein